MPEDGIDCVQHEDILSLEEIRDFVAEVVPLGITKVRLTGGEPLVRKGIVKLVRMLAQVKGITDLAMTTNAMLLAQMAQDLKDAGLMRINISLDTLNPQKFYDITRGGNIQNVFDGIKAAKDAGFEIIKINAVRFQNNSSDEENNLKAFCQNEGLDLRFIHQMNLKTGEFSVVEGGEGGNCSQCNRIRLTSNGIIKPCLFADNEFSIRELGISQAVKQAVLNKPKCGTVSNNNNFYSVGG